MQIKPIETSYRGYRFRSRVEARWAVFFDAMGIKWEYEKEGYSLNGIRYLPDFWLPQVSMWAEVKPGKFSIRDKTKAKRLVELDNHPLLMLIGIPDFVNYYAIEKEPWTGDVIVGWDYSLVDYYLEGGRKGNEHRFPCSNYIPDNDPDAWPVKYHEAIAAARSARFEFGETGA